jgi:uncharacterized protein
MASEPCPICEKPVLVGSEFHPFCCRRCKLVDLGRWLGESYRVPATKADEDEADGEETE